MTYLLKKINGNVFGKKKKRKGYIKKFTLLLQLKPLALLVVLVKGEIKLRGFVVTMKKIFLTNVKCFVFLLN